MKSEMKKLAALTQRHIKIYFKDKTMFLVSLITPMILIVLFLTFLGNTYETSLLAFLPEGVTLPKRLLKGFTGGWLFSSIMATTSITVAFCSNVLVNDKTGKQMDDFNLTPVRRTTIQLSYFLANFCTTFLVCVAALVVGMLYLAVVGWYLSLLDVVMLLVVIILNILFGTLLASLISRGLNSQGALSAVCTLVSSMYGFVCGAYMPLAQFTTGIRTAVGFLPGTYATVLFRRYFMGGTLTALHDYLPDATVDAVSQSFDGSITMFDHIVPVWLMFVILLVAIVVLAAIYLLTLKPRRRR